MACGNFGASPKPPFRASYDASNPCAARASSSGETAPLGRTRSVVANISRIEVATRCTSSGRLSYASATACSTRRKDGIPGRSSGGKYVPPQNGSRFGVRNMVIGQPPCPVIAWTACM